MARSVGPGESVSWVKLDDRFADHPKVLAAGALAGFMWVCGLAYANSQKKRDGFIPATKVPVLYPLPSPMKLAKKLVAVGLWEERDDGYQIHDYHDFQPSDDVRSARSEAGRRGGQRSGATRRAKQESKQLASSLLPEIEANDQQGASKAQAIASNPVPGPVPTEEAEADASAPELVPIDDLLGSGSAEEITAPARKEQRACRLPKDFPLTAALRKVATDNGCRDPEVMHAAFVDYWRGTGRRMVDWTATYRTWARNGHCGNVLKACACLKTVVRGALGQELKGSQAALRRAGERILAGGAS